MTSFPRLGTVGDRAGGGPSPSRHVRTRARTALAAWLLAVLTAVGASRADEAGLSAAARDRADTGPGPTTVYPHQKVRRTEYGRGARSYWLFEPADPVPTGRVPVVVLNHGWLAVNPVAYGAWIDHLARSGLAVIYPRYQTDALTPPAEFLPNALAATVDGLDVLESAPGHVRPDRSRFALIGHSAGGNLAAQMAAVAAGAGLPRPLAVVALMPGEVQSGNGPDLAGIPADTLLVVAVADGDIVVGDLRAREIFTQATAVPKSRKAFVFYRSDHHGTPRLVAHHFAPTAALPAFDTGDGLFLGFQISKAEVNALDRAGFWRLTDLTLDAAFTGRTLDDATRRGETLRHLGYWSDGRPVVRPVVGTDLATMPRVHPTYGVRLIPWTPSRLFNSNNGRSVAPAPIDRIVGGRDDATVRR